MKHLTALLLIIASAVSGCAHLGSTGQSGAPGTETLARQLLITMRQDSGATSAYRGDPSTFYFRRRGYGPTPSIDRSLDEIADDYGIRRVEGWYIASIGEYCEVYELLPDQNLTETLASLSSDPRVSLVQAMNVFETEGLRYDDPYASMQPALATLAIESAHEFATGAGVTVAVVDSSVDRRHLELRGKVRSELDLVGRGLGHGAEVHGTAVAGIIGSTANNGVGIVGIAPDATIASFRACWTVDEASGRALCSSFSLARALESAIQRDVDVINLSLAGPPDSLLQQLIDTATEQGTIVVAAMPEHPDPKQSFPSSHRQVIAVESEESPSGIETPNLLRAPGAEVVSTTPNNSYAFFSGNSMSAAYISGISALIREHHPEIGPAELIQLLESSGEKHHVNACRAIAHIEHIDRCLPETN